MVDLNPQFQALLDNQLQMNPQTWAALQGRGVDENTLVIIDFAFTAKGKREADGLTSFLREKTTFSAVARAERGTRFRKRWIVRGRTKPSTTSLKMLNDWVTFMVKTGYTHACHFDGWGVEVPDAASPQGTGAGSARAPHTNGTVKAMAAERQTEQRPEES
ncbi:MAG: hypothetical protein QOF69_810 [Solirubrobacteraceae bacterium]|jgi:hypothetical protein|nr:hypothetical protein [Solirubrobacteraceae bacterium]